MDRQTSNLTVESLRTAEGSLVPRGIARERERLLKRASCFLKLIDDSELAK